MFKRFLPVALALLITLATAAYQRRTGPTHPKKVEFRVGETRFHGELIRSGTTGEDAAVSLESDSKQASPPLFLQYRKYRFEESWTVRPFAFESGVFVARLPTLPSAGKYEYRISSDGSLEASPLTDSVVIRFKGAVPLYWLIPHIIAMFAAMFLSNLVAMRLLFRKPVGVAWPAAVLLTLGIGGMFFGAFVQRCAFGEYWTGFPYGTDLTDNKTLIAFVGWGAALVAFRRFPKSALWAAIVIMTLVFAIPHSLAGSERDFKTGKIGSAELGASKQDLQKGGD